MLDKMPAIFGHGVAALIAKGLGGVSGTGTGVGLAAALIAEEANG